jgi:hypothetical protein
VGAKVVGMPDFYAMLDRMLREANSDPAKFREFVHEAARLALRSQLGEQGKRVSIVEAKCQVDNLEIAIARMEASAGSGNRDADKFAAETVQTSVYDPRVDKEAAFHSQEMTSTDRAADKNTSDRAQAPVSHSQKIISTDRSPNKDAASHSQESASIDRGADKDAADTMQAVASDTDVSDSRETTGTALAELAGLKAVSAVLASCNETAPPSAELGAPDPNFSHHVQNHSGRHNFSSDETYPKRRTPFEGQSLDSETAPPHAESRAEPPGFPGEDICDPRQVVAVPLRASPNGPHPMTEWANTSKFAGNSHYRGSSRIPLWDDKVKAERADFAAQTESRDLVLLSNRGNRSAYIVTPNDFISPEVSWRPSPRSRYGLVMFGLMAATQLIITTLAGLAFYVSVWGHNGAVQIAQDMVPGGSQTANGQPFSVPDRMVATASLGATLFSPGLPFALPTAYGVYAVRDNQLIELEQVQTAPADPRTRTQLQIAKPPRLVIDAQRLDFLVFRRELISTAPDRVQVRIASRIAQSTIFDTNGKPTVVKPPTDTWFIREKGWDLRVSPLRENSEMVILHTEDPYYLLSAGRYELLLGGQAYDFTISGEVTDPAHCVEGVATPRGPVFYECKRER